MLTQLDWPNVQQIVQSATLNIVHRARKLNQSAGIINMFKTITPRIHRGKASYPVRHAGNCKRNPNNFSACNKKFQRPNPSIKMPFTNK